MADSPDPDPVEVARRIADTLEDAGIAYAIGGALALGYAGVVRATKDVDLNVFLGVDDADRGLAALERAGVVLDRQSALARIAEGAHVRGMLGVMPIDAFFDSIPLHTSAARRAVTRPLAGRPAHILSAEDLIVLKLLFHRPKDIIDVERIVAVRGASLDRDYVRNWLVDCVGDDDYRVSEWDTLVRDLGPQAAPVPPLDADP